MRTVLLGGDHGAATTDPDDVQLLPAPDKLDMRSVHSGTGNSTDCETENYTYEDYEAKEKERDEYGNSSYGQESGGATGAALNTLSSKTMSARGGANERDGSTPKAGNGGGMSSLAAMGVASTLAARSFTPTNVDTAVVATNHDEDTNDMATPASTPGAAELTDAGSPAEWSSTDSSAAHETPGTGTGATPTRARSGVPRRWARWSLQSKAARRWNRQRRGRFGHTSRWHGPR